MQLSDPAAERATLSCLFQYGSNAWAEIAGLIGNETFTFESNSLYYECFEYLFKQGYEKVDQNAIWSAAETLGHSDKLKKPDEVKYLRSLKQCAVELSNVRKYASKIKKLEIARRGKRLGAHISHSLDKVTGDESINDIISLIETPVFDFSTNLGDTQDNGPTLMGDGIEDYLKYLENNPREYTGIPTGYSRIDDAMGGGLQVGVNLFGARPKKGKTTLADNVGMFISQRINIPVLNLDSEMNKQQHWDRILANLAKVNVKEIRTGKYVYDEDKVRRVHEAAEKLKVVNYSYEPIRGMDINDILSICRRWIMKSVGLQTNGVANPCVIIYDYLKLPGRNSVTDSIKEHLALGFQINQFHDFLAKYEIPSMSLIQLNREGIEREETDIVSGSDRQVWTCVSFLLFKEKSNAEIMSCPNKKYNRKVVPLVTRFGEEWDRENYINMEMRGQFAEIIEGETQYELTKNQKKGELVDDPSTIPDDAKQF
jgi:replicative DNA helicase